MISAPGKYDFTPEEIRMISKIAKIVGTVIFFISIIFALLLVSGCSSTPIRKGDSECIIKRVSENTCMVSCIGRTERMQLPQEYEIDANMSAYTYFTSCD